MSEREVLLSLAWSLALALMLNTAAQATPTVTITDTSGVTQSNRPISIAQPFKEGDVIGNVQASVGAGNVPTQTDIKNTWPDGSLKFAIVSFVIPSLPGGGSVSVSFNGGGTGNNTPLTQSQMLDPAYNFDGQIQLNGGAQTISARSILNAAASCVDPGNDPDSSTSLCRYWLKGPIVTAVILEDRTPTRSFDVSTDGGSGNPLHPIFEVWFYPSNHAVQLGYTLENSWASANPANSARDQTYSVVLTGGNSSPVTEFTNGTFTHITRSRWHKTFWLNQPDPTTTWTIDHNWSYLAQTRFTPNWDASLSISPAKISSEVNGLFSNTGALALQGCASCVGGGAGVGYFETALNATGAAEWHGPLTTWDIIYLMTQDPGMYKVMIANADLAGRIPYFYREADTNAGHGGYFDAPRNTVGTFGRVISINARTQISLDDVTTNGNLNQCNVNYATDWITFGGSGQDKGGWDSDTSHWPNLAYASYLTTGQYAYYEEQMMQSAYAIGDSPGTRACALPANHASSRQGALGYWGSDQERQEDWMARENALGAFIAVDGSPEQAYFLDKLRTNLAVWEGSHNIPCDIPGTGVQEPYCGTSTTFATAWSFGNGARTGVPWSGTTLGSWTDGVCSGAINCYVDGPTMNTTGLDVPAAANSNFQNDYSGLVLGWLNDLGYCPGSCAMLQFVENRFINIVQDPNANMFDLGQYIYPTLDQNGNQITSWAENKIFYGVTSTSWGGGSSLCGDEGYGAESVAALSYGYNMISNEGYSGSAAYNKARPSLMTACTAGNTTFADASPKWDIVPRLGGAPPPPTNSPCDVNGDGNVNVLDVQKEVTMALKLAPCTNPSGQCTVIQVEDVVNAVLGGQCVNP